jgi:glutaconate CoA-transferase subunit A
VAKGAIALKESTCPAIHAALQAGEKGLPFMPLRGIIGSDILEHRPDWKVIDNPFGRDDPIVVLPALRPELALFHAPLGDRHGNVWLGLVRELVTLAHAAHGALVTVEEVYDGNLLDDERLAPGTLSDLYVTAVAEAPRGAWPLGLAGRYDVDGEHLAEYARLAADEAGFARYLERYLGGAEAAE